MSTKQSLKEYFGVLLILISVWLAVFCDETICPELCHCRRMQDGVAAECDGKDLPSIVALLPNNTVQFRYTALEYNIRLDAVSFEHLPELRTLSISTTYDDNVLDKMLAPIPTSKQNIFAPLKNLQRLAININWEFDNPLDMLFQPLVNLEELDLSDTRVLNIRNLRQAMNGLRNHSRLHTIDLSNIQTYELATHQTFNLSWFLEPLQNCPLKTLNLAYNAFKAIYPGIIRYAPQLESLDASHNLLAPLFASAFFLEAALHKGLNHMDFSYQGFRYDDQEHRRTRRSAALMPPTSDEVTPDITGLQIERGLDGDGLRQLLEGSQIGHGVGVVPDLDLFNKCISAVQNDTCAILSPSCRLLKGILEVEHDWFCELLYERFDPPKDSDAVNFFRGIPCEAIPTINETVRQGCADCTVIPTIGNTSSLNLKNLNIYDEVFMMRQYRGNSPKCFNPLNRLEILDLSENFEHGYRGIDFFLSTEVTGLDTVKLFNLSNTGLTKFYFKIQKTFPQLRVLDLSHNQISLNVSEDDSLLSMLEGRNSTIEVFFLGHNRIRSVPRKFFRSMPNLKQLDLGRNQIERIDFDVSGLHSLEWLNLEYNMLSELPEMARDQLTQLAEYAASQGRIITVDLSNNQLSCACSSIPFLAFMHYDKPENLYFNKYPKYLCLDQGNSRVYLQKKASDILSMRVECLSNGALIGIGFGCASIVFPIIIALKVFIYKKRWWFRYQYFLAHRVWQNYHQIASFETPYQYDLFVSYNQRDQQWIDDVLQPKLEDELGLNLCLHHRDFRLGEVITEQILESVETSRKTLFVLSPSFLASTWCHFEIQMAQNRLFSSGEDVILLALLEPLPTRKVSRTLKGLLETRTYVEWTEDVYGQRLFWAKLHEAIQAPIQKPYDLEEQNPPLRFGTPREEHREEQEPLLARSGLTESWHQVQSQPVV